MKDIEALLEKENLEDSELDCLIAKIKQDYWPSVKNKVIPRHCGQCKLFKLCRIINPKLLCPWLN